MREKWITNYFFMIYGFFVISNEVHADVSGGKSTLLLYSTDLSSDNLISIQLDSITLNEIIADSEKQGRIVKKINFRDLKRLNELFTGKSTSFSFIDDAANSACDINCSASCKRMEKSTTTRAQPRPFVAKKDANTGPPYLPPVTTFQKDEGITPPTTTKRPEITTRSFPTVTSSLATATTRRQIQIVTTTSKAPKETQKPTTSTKRPTTPFAVAVTRSKSTPGPSYLPLARKSTIARSTVSSGTTYPPATWPSTSRIYTQTFPTWSAPIRRVTYEPKSTTTTVRYEYKEPSNSLIYANNLERK